MDEENNDSGINSGSDFHASSPESNSIDCPVSSPEPFYPTPVSMATYNTSIPSRMAPQAFAKQDLPVDLANIKSEDEVLAPKNFEMDSYQQFLRARFSMSEGAKEGNDPLLSLQQTLAKNGFLAPPASPNQSENSGEENPSENRSEGGKSENGDFGGEFDEESLRAPMLNSHGKVKKHKCKQCGFVAFTKYDFWDHTKTHIREDRLLTCPKCPFVTEYKHHLEYHLRNHTGSKPFKCDRCNYSCVNKSMLNSHKKSHSKVYQYRCADCSYATKYCHSLKLHLRKYTHKPAMVLNPDGTPNPLPIIDVYGTRRGPKSKPAQKEAPASPQDFAQKQLMNLMMHNPQFPFAFPVLAGLQNALALQLQSLNQRMPFMDNPQAPAGLMTPPSEEVLDLSGPRTKLEPVVELWEETEVGHGKSPDKPVASNTLAKQDEGTDLSQGFPKSLHLGDDGKNLNASRSPLDGMGLMMSPSLMNSAMSTAMINPKMSPSLTNPMMYPNMSNPMMNPNMTNPIMNPNMSPKISPRMSPKMSSPTMMSPAMVSPNRMSPIENSTEDQKNSNESFNEEATPERLEDTSRNSKDSTGCIRVKSEFASNNEGFGYINQGFGQSSQGFGPSNPLNQTFSQFCQSSGQLQNFGQATHGFGQTNQGFGQLGQSFAQNQTFNPLNSFAINPAALARINPWFNQLPAMIAQKIPPLSPEGDSRVERSSPSSRFNKEKNEEFQDEDLGRPGPSGSQNVGSRKRKGQAFRRENLEASSSDDDDEGKTLVKSEIAEPEDKNGNNDSNNGFNNNDNNGSNNNDNNNGSNNNNNNNGSYNNNNNNNVANNNLVEEEEDSHKCKFCSIGFGDAILYSMHMGYHGFKEPFTCNMCGEECKDKISFNLHIARVRHN